MSNYNTTQKISLIVGITTFIAWLTAGINDGMFYNSVGGIYNRGLAEAFDTNFDILLFSIFCGSVATFYLFKVAKRKFRFLHV